ncbi:MAG: hypothetical protein ACFCU6_11080 [Balneolaceae bacterium]
MPLNQKKWIVILLAFSCAAALFLLFDSSDTHHKTLYSASQLDSLIINTLHHFNLPESQIKKQTIQIDSVFSRKIYTVQVAPSVSKTSLHYRLHRQLLPYNVDSPAKISLPGYDMDIQLVYNDTVIRTITLKTDPGLQPFWELSADSD